MAGVVELASETGSQQNVSRFHNLQLKFSSLRPSSNDPEHLENTKTRLVYDYYLPLDSIALTCPHAEEVLDVSCVNLVNKADIHGQDWCV